jgi:hypothetical protein
MGYHRHRPKKLDWLEKPFTNEVATGIIEPQVRWRMGKKTDTIKSENAHSPQMFIGHLRGGT